MDVGLSPLRDRLASGGGALLAAAAKAAAPAGGWRVFGELVLSSTEGPDPLLSFDPVMNPVPGLELSSWVRRLREPAYRTARRSRGSGTGRESE